MKLFVFAIIIAIGTASPSLDGAVFSFVGKTMFMFADVKEGEQLSHSFEFTNTGNEPLIISGYKVACSCTKAIFSEAPILPGKKSEIKITFDTNGKYGFQDRIIKVYSNANKSSIKLRIKVFVEAGRK
jgi:hypothetical protein